MSRVTLGDVAVERRESCKGDKSRYPVVGLEHLTPEEITLTAWDESGENTFTKIFHKGDILFGRRRAYLKKAALAPFDGICSGDITVIEAKPNYILPELLPFVIQNDTFFDFAVGKSAGSLSPRVKWEHLKELKFNLPSIEEQKNISKVLWSVNDTIEKYKKLTELTDELVKAKFVEMFGDRYINDRSWPTVLLGESISFNNGKAHEQVVDEDGEYILVTSRAIVSDFMDVRRTNALLFPLHKNDIVMVMSDLPNGRALAKCQLIDEDNKYTLNQRICSFDKYNFNPIFLLNLLNRHQYFLDFNDGNGQTNLRKNDILGCTLIVPPMELQEQFADFVKQVDKSKSELEQATTTAKVMMKRIIAENLG